MSSKTKGIRIVAVALLLAVLFTLGLGVRRYVLTAAFGDIPSRDVPFTLESALQSRFIKIILDRGWLPAHDEMIQCPEGIVPARTYTVFVYYLQAVLCRFFPAGVEFSERLRWIESGWFCLAIPLLALWGWRATGRWSAGFIAGFLYAVSIASVQRSTGAELSTENTALPFLAAYFFFRESASRAPPDGKFTSYAVASALCLALAVTSWDLMQFYLFLWAGWAVWLVARGRWQWSAPGQRIWMIEWAALFLTGLLVPYHRAHGLLLSPAMLAATATMAVLWFRGRAGVCAHAGALRRPTWKMILVGVGVLALLTMSSRYYTDAYGHFFELLWAKIRFLNVKPEDPALLSFDQRLMWTPALHSPTFLLTMEILLVLCAITLPAAVAVGRLSQNHRDPDLYHPVVCYVCSLLAYVFFFRFHVFVVFFGAMVAAAWWGVAVCGEVSRRALVCGWIGFGSLGEAFHTMKGPWQVTLHQSPAVRKVLDGHPAAALWGAREGLAREEQIELTNWLDGHVKPETVLAGFGLSGAIATYGRCGIVLHPKFETKVVRDKVKEYAEELFTGTVRSFRNWADRQGATYYVYASGSFSTNEPSLQLRYMVNALNPPATAPARLFESGKDDGYYFRSVFSNRKYHVFKILTMAEEVAASVAMKRATDAFEKGDLDAAEREAVRALEANPNQAGAQKILQHVYSLRNKGFTIGRDAGR